MVGNGSRPTRGWFEVNDRMFYVYLLASEPYGTLYVGTTSDLTRRIAEHKAKLVPGFTKKYGIDRLVWFEVHETADAALRRENQIKEWKRDWKINLIERDNRHWTDLYPTLPLA
jgi:putative endonuclease